MNASRFAQDWNKAEYMETFLEVQFTKKSDHFLFALDFFFHQ